MNYSEKQYALTGFIAQIIFEDRYGSVYEKPMVDYHQMLERIEGEIISDLINHNYTICRTHGETGPISFVFANVDDYNLLKLMYDL